MIGLDLDYFWSLDVNQFNKYIETYTEKEERRLKEIDQFNWLLGKYIAYAFNDVKHYPTKAFLDTDTHSNVTMSDEDMERQARLNTLRLGGAINDNRRVTGIDNS